MSVVDARADRRTARPPPAPVSPAVLLSELRLIFGRRRNQVGLAGLAAVPIVIASR